MAKKNDSWGIEIGANAIKAMRLIQTGDQLELADYAIIPFKPVLTAPDVDVEKKIKSGLDKFTDKHDLSRSNVVISVPGHMAFARFAKLPPVEPKKIPEIVRFEAVQQIPFPIDQVEWDYQMFEHEDSPDVEVGIFAITKDRVLKVLNNYRGANIEVDTITLSPLAVYNAFAYENEGKNAPGTIYLDIGAKSTDVIIVEQGRIWLRTLPIGGNNFTDALVRSFKLSFNKAEKLKREAGTSKYARQIFQAMRPVFADLVQELQRSLGYYQSVNRESDLKRLMGIGSTFRLPGLRKFLKQQLQLEVVRPERFRRVQMEGKRESEFAEYALNMATAYGCALQGLDMQQVSANLLPEYLLKQRMWRAKQPWIAATAASVAAASVLFTGTTYMADRAADDRADASNHLVQPILRDARDVWGSWQDAESEDDPRQQIENFNRILDYRDLWPKVLEDLAQAASNVDPDGDHHGLAPNELAEIPRTERRRIYIDQFLATYHVQLPEADVQQDADEFEQQGEPSRGRTGGRQRTTRGGSSNNDVNDELGETFTAADFFSDEQRPQFKIVLEGRTPYEDATNLLHEHFISWLNDNAERADRPYRFVIASNENQVLPSISRVGPSDSDEPARRPGGGGDRPGGGGARGSSGDDDTLANILPNDPFAGENRERDSQFRIEWIVELRSPEEIRHRGESDEPDEPDDPDESEDAPVAGDGSADQEARS